MELKFWGVRGSIPTPMPSSEIEKMMVRALTKASPKDIKNSRAARAFVKRLPFPERGAFGGNTACVELQAGNTEIILDAGSGLKNLGKELMKREFGKGKGEAHIFISHTHWDHIQGFPFFTPAFIPGNKITIYSPLDDIAQRFKEQNRFEFFPVTFDKLASAINFVTLTPGEPVTINGEVTVNFIELNHPGRAFGYRIEHQGKKVMYATDVEYTDLGENPIRNYVDFYHGCDVLISDSQYTLAETFNKKFWGHSSAMMGVELALAANIKTLVLFHHEPEYNNATINKILKQAHSYMRYIPSGKRCDILIGREGLIIKL